ncbi:MAG: methyltransferase RsmF C-terminal domain-like protein [Spirosomataceae bacterium]
MTKDLLPAAFVSQIEAQLGAESVAFFEAIAQQPPVSIRVNPRKGTENLPDLLPTDFEKVPWHPNGYYLPERPSFTVDPVFQAGGYYVQEASSMFVAEAVRQTMDTSKPLRVLDLCAAPGGKTTTLAAELTENSFLMANEVIKSRIPALKENLLKWGFTNYVVTNHDPETMAELEGFFDVVLVDAPCSGEGLFRKDDEAAKEWSVQHVELCSARQKRILKAAAFLVAPNGVLVYSTCTYNAQENDENVAYITKITELERIDLSLPTEFGIQATQGGAQFYPHKLKGEGFYLAVFRQKGRGYNRVDAKVKLNQVRQRQLEKAITWLKESSKFQYFLKNEGTIVALRKENLADYGKVFYALSKHSSGFEIGLFKGEAFIPSHALALSNELNDRIPRVELSFEDAQKYFKRETLSIDQSADLPDSSQSGGWLVATYKGYQLGWLKDVQGRINNYLPKDWRIRMDIPA